ncbi:MAG: hypothetical protein ND866_14435 [Pyrinomonadaceae bacterium]|nr:hypothetical protein [Pyrinomonadaceae bacterium]
MSLTSKLLTAISVVFILTVAGAIGVTAQTRTTSDNSSSSTAASAAVTTDPKKAEGTTPSAASVEQSAPEKTAEANREANNSSTSVNVPSGTPVLPSPQQPDPDKWQFVFSPYFWMAGLHGRTGGPNRTVQVDESFSDIFDSLKFAFMGVFEAHKNKWAIQTDVEFVSLEDEKATPGPLFSSANAKIKTFVFTPEVGYKIYSDPDKGSFVQVLGGTRIWRISSDLTFNAGLLPAVQIKDSRSWVDGVVGLRGKAALSEKFFFMGRFDVGGGGSKFTYQLFGGLGYNLNKKVALVGGYRALDVNYDRNNFLYDTSQRGPIMGVGFKF